MPFYQKEFNRDLTKALLDITPQYGNIRLIKALLEIDPQYYNRRELLRPALMSGSELLRPSRQETPKDLLLSMEIPLT